MNDINFTMYKLAGIIAEYDPFHNGHAWQLQQAKALGAQRVAVAMSCGLTQRGALPLLPESVRVQAALTCGADLVFALPAPYACSGAECFARAGVQLLAAAGCDALVFGAETPDAALLMEAARVLSGAEYRTALKARLATGARSFAAARQAAVEAVCPGTGLAALLDKPNNNLAVEYCKAILELGASLVPIPLPRQGAGHGPVSYTHLVEGQLVVLGVVAAHKNFKAIAGGKAQEVGRLLALVALLVVFQVALTLELGPDLVQCRLTGGGLHLIEYGFQIGDLLFTLCQQVYQHPGGGLLLLVVLERCV